MIRRRWVRVEWPLPIRDIAKLIQKNLFTQKSIRGFHISKTRINYIEGRYYERLDIEDVIIDPIGHRTEIMRFEYKETNFIISDAPAGLEIIGPGSRNRSFINALSEICENSLPVSMVEIDPLAWSREFISIISEEAFVDRMQILQLSFLPGVSAKMVFQGAEDIQNAVSSLIRDKGVIFEKVSLTFKSSLKSKIVLTNNGMASFTGAKSAEFENDARQSLYKIMNIY